MIAVLRPQVALSSGAIEAAKWLALGCMVVDHVNAVFFGREWGQWATVLGRVAFPLFAIVLGVNLARPGADALGLLRRLCLFGALAFVPYVVLFGQVGVWPLNVMWTFAVAVGVVWAMDRGEAMIAGLLFACGGLLVEYGWAGVSLVVASVALARWRHHGWPWVPFVIAMTLLCWVNGNAWAILCLPVLGLLEAWAPHVPRSGRFFWWFYPVHLAILAFMAGV